MPFFGSLLVAATVVALPASAQTVAAPRRRRSHKFGAILLRRNCRARLVHHL